MCLGCSASEQTHSLPTSLIVHHCRGCDRYHTPPKEWTLFAWYTDDMLLWLTTILKRKTRQQFEIKLEPSVESSRQIKAAVFLGVNRLEVKVTFKVRNLQCKLCERREAKQYFTSIVQVRQRCDEKRTIAKLEGILPKKLLLEASDIKLQTHGIDFLFQAKAPAMRLVNWIRDRFPAKFTKSMTLISEDKKSNTCKCKFAYSLELPPINKNEVIKISKELANKKGTDEILIVNKVDSFIKATDPMTNKKIRIGNEYWLLKNEIEKVSHKSVIMTVTDIVDKKTENGQTYYDLFLCSGNKSLFARSFLSNINLGDKMLGFDLENEDLGLKCVVYDKEKKVKDVDVETKKIKMEGVMNEFDKMELDV